jgi:hypothetical protein
MENLVIAIISAAVSLLVPVITVRAMRRNEIILQNKRLKEDYYAKLLEGISLATDDKPLKEYVLNRNKIWVAASEDVIQALLSYEEIVKPDVDMQVFQEAYSKLVATMRKDLGMKDKKLPLLHLRVANKGK